MHIFSYELLQAFQDPASQTLIRKRQDSHARDRGVKNITKYCHYVADYGAAADFAPSSFGRAGFRSGKREGNLRMDAGGRLLLDLRLFELLQRLFNELEAEQELSPVNGSGFCLLSIHACGLLWKR